MGIVKEFFSTAPVIAWSLVSVMAALVVMASNWPKVKWWWHNTWYSLPVLGKIASLSRDSNRDTTDPSWFKAEKTLCRDYKKFIRVQDEHDFNEKVEYLNKAGDTGRGAIPAWIWAITGAMVFIEAMGFSYVLAGYTIPGASENLQQTASYGIAFLLSVLLMVLTHASGHELYVSGKIKNARREWVEGGRKGKPSTQTIPLAKAQSADDDAPAHVQLMNRVGSSPGYLMSYSSVVFILVVAIGATFVRGQVLEKQLQHQITGQLNAAPALSGDAFNMAEPARGQIALPVDDAAANRSAEVKAVEDEASIDRRGGWGTFIVLAFIFVFLQILGVFFGYRWGFAGKNSKDAYRAMGYGRYATYAEVREHYRDVADTAQSKLEHLQQKLMERNGASGTDGLHTTKTFFEFMDTERDREFQERHREIQRTAQRSAMESAAPLVQGRPQSIEVPAPSPAPVPAPFERATAVPDVGQALDTLKAMGDDKTAKKNYITSLPESLQAQVVAALKVQKEEEQRRAEARDAELDDLL